MTQRTKPLAEAPPPSAGASRAAETIFPWLSNHYQAELRRQKPGNGTERLAEIIDHEVQGGKTMTQQSKFTPGPWEVANTGGTVLGCQMWIESQRDEQTRGQYSGRHIAEIPANLLAREANARLIAAAPDLLDAAKQAVKQEGDWLGVLDLAIAKAEQT